MGLDRMVIGLLFSLFSNVSYRNNPFPHCKTLSVQLVVQQIACRVYVMQLVLQLSWLLLLQKYSTCLIFANAGIVSKWLNIL